MADNGSPDPIFETDINFTRFLTILPVNSSIGLGDSNGESNGAKQLSFKNIEEIITFSNGASNGASEIIKNQVHDKVSEVLEILTIQLKREDLFELMGLSNQSRNRAKYLDPLIKVGYKKNFLTRKQIQTRPIRLQNQVKEYFP